MDGRLTQDAYHIETRNDFTFHPRSDFRSSRAHEDYAELRAETAWMQDEAVFIHRRKSVMLLRRIINFSMKRMNLACSNVTQLWYRTHILIGSKVIQRKTKLRRKRPKFVPPDQKSCIVHTDYFCDFSVLVMTRVGITISQPHTHPKTRN